MKIIISMGDCNGIGAEVMAKAIQRFDNTNDFASDCEIAVTGNSRVLASYFSLLKIPVNFVEKGFYIGKRFCRLYECSANPQINFGMETEEAGLLAAEAVELAVIKTLAGDYDGLVTMPISKKAVYLAGWKYPGHTEMLADRCKTNNYQMILCTKEIRVALVTIHIPIIDVPKNISSEAIIENLSIFDKSLKQDFSISEPKIAVLSLNPHAGENGSIGSEEGTIIKPALNLVSEKGINVDGPMPADGFFAHGEYMKYDGILAMYHDQGLIPLKLLAKGGGVNFTAGIPIVRTSPDHGTAFAIAGKGIADEESSFQALEMAVDIINSRKKLKHK